MLSRDLFVRWTSRILAVTATVASVVPASAEPLRVMTYNILNYSSGRTTAFQTALDGIEPDIIVVQEVLSQSGVNNFLNTVLNVLEPGEWTAGPFVNGPDTDNGLYYRTSTVDFVSHFVIGTTLRDIDEWTVRPAGYPADANIRLYVVHLKASQGSSNEARRLEEVQAMRVRMETFPAGESYMVLGDFNIYNSGEPAYQYMLGTSGGTAGVVEDPIDSPGTWHNGPAFAAIHTQSPRTTQFGGGANGGMDDRFDIILTSPSFQDGAAYEVIDGSYTTYGQDGLHYNIALTDPPDNQVVPQVVAQALHDASDHLPVYVDITRPSVIVADASLDLGTIIVGGASSADVSVSNSAPADADVLDYSFVAPTGFTAPAGSFMAVGGDPANLHPIGLDSSTAGAFSDDLEIPSDAINDLATVAVSGTVLDHAAPSVVAGVVETNGLVNFGSQEIGNFSDQPANVYNIGYDALQAVLDVHDGVLSGDARFSIVDGFSPASVADTPATYTLTFDDTGATPGTYTATFTLSTRDQQDLSGAIDLATLTFDVTATVTTSVSSPDPVGPIVAGIHRVFPNPFRPSTSITYGVSDAGLVRLDIFDVSGRLVRRLIDAPLGTGLYDVRWDGRSDAHAIVAPGIYYLRLRTPGSLETRRVVRLR